MGGLLIGGDVELFSPAYIGPHVQGALHVGAPEIVVPHRPTGQPHPSALEAHLAFPVHHIAAGGDIQPGSLWMLPGDGGVQGVNPLEDGHLVRAKAQGSALAVVAHAPGELEVGEQDFLSPG